MTISPALLLKFNRNEQIQLQEKCFESQENCDQLVEAFHKCLKEGDKYTTIQRSANGCTGFTFLCSVPANKINNQFSEQPLEFVLKWQNKTQCSVEKFGAKLFSQLGFPAPIPISLASDLSSRVAKMASKKCQSFSYTQEHDLIAMPKLHASNFKEALKNNSVKKCSIQDQAKIIKELGKISAVDLVLANNDRLISFTSDPNDPFHQASKFNSGNVMLELDKSQEPYTFVKMYPIDNCPAPDLIVKGKVVEEEHEYALENLFNTEDDDWESEPYLEKIGEGPQVLSPEQVVDGYHQVFQKLITNTDYVTTHAYQNIKKDISDHTNTPQDYDNFLEMVQNKFKEGFLESLHDIKSFDFALDESTDKTSQYAVQLFLENLQNLKQNL